ncbi:hypothetical protein COT29_02055 [Candidatus Micrarchaeota archaeon CG08_land_8_20_14_0_20_59_11]|nr:MAG: hypothetical protein COT29_02055 [Candidatus Micrarchaeota archaeon CG08_land_8_20_14_0_20_59_11]PIT85599.1 MAG: hypothetical protein COU36_02325 [Candidatus Micrarchaeota archaeon CG10_big_fil_rev_8_21_14_0_10_59_7]
MQELVFPKSDKVQAYVDDRELKSDVCKALFEKGALLLPKRLDVGDFILSGRVCMERKNAADFESSIVDGRLFQQAQAMRENFASPLLALVGGDFQRLNPKALRGAFISLAVDYRIPLFFFDTDAELADFLYALGEREQLRAPQERKVQFEKRCATMADRQRLIVESLPNVGPKGAKALLRHFGSIESAFSADEDELQDVEGIGGKTAKEIREVIEAEYGECADR